MIIAILSDGSPNLWSILPLVKKDRFFVVEKQGWGCLRHGDISGSSFLILKFNDSPASLFSCSCFTAAFGSGDVKRIESSGFSVYLLIHDSRDILHNKTSDPCVPLYTHFMFFARFVLCISAIMFYVFRPIHFV